MSHCLHIFYDFPQSRTFPPLPNHKQNWNQETNVGIILVFNQQALFSCFSNDLFSKKFIILMCPPFIPETHMLFRFLHLSASGRFSLYYLPWSWHFRKSPGHFFCRLSPDLDLSEFFSQLNSDSASDKNLTEAVMGFPIASSEVACNFHFPVLDGIHFDHGIKVVSARLLHSKVPLFPLCN